MVIDYLSGNYHNTDIILLCIEFINRPVTPFIAPCPPKRIVVFGAGTTIIQMKHEKRDTMSYCGKLEVLCVICDTLNRRKLVR